MGLQDKKYHGIVRSGSEMIESQSGTLGYQVMLQCEDGQTSYTIWLTKATRERAEKTFVEALGVDPAKLQNASYIENQLANDITGREVTFIMEQEEYKGKTRLKVAWLFKRSATSGQNPAKAAASFFGKKEPSMVPAPHDEINDEDIPF